MHSFYYKKKTRKRKKTPNCLNATSFYCTKRKEKRQTTDWVITKPNRRSPGSASYLKLTLSPILSEATGSAPS